MIAEEAGLTTGAIYHYFDRKIDIFTAVHREAQDHVYERFEKSIVECTTFLAQLEAVLETAHDLNNEDPSIALFLGSCRIDAARDPSIAAALRDSGGDPHASFWNDMIEFGVRTGEIEPDQRATISVVIRTITTGLTDAVSDDRRRHRIAVDGVLQLLNGRLISAAEPDKVRPGSPS